VKYLVTGGAGFIGSHIAERLLDVGHDVVIYDDLSSGSEANVEELEPAAANGASLEFVQADLLDRSALAEAMSGCAAVFHQAAVASVPRSFRDPMGTLRTNVEGTALLLQLCEQRGPKTLVMASSSAVYDDSPELPKHEGMITGPLSPYGLSKRVDEQLMHMWSRDFGVRTVGLRYFNVFGPRQDPNSEYAAVIPKFITRMLAGEQPIIFGDGLQSRDFIYVGDIVAANLCAAGVDPATGTPASEAPAIEAVVANVGAGDRYTLLDLVDAINDVLGTALEPRFEPARSGEVRDSQAAIDQARESLGFAPSVSFRDGLERTVAWFADRQRAVRRTA
jgi:UDP-glucose 4-epimerase